MTHPTKQQCACGDPDKRGTHGPTICEHYPGVGGHVALNEPSLPTSNEETLKAELQRVYALVDHWHGEAVKWEGEEKKRQADIKLLKQELWVIATAIWENISRDEVKHWAQGIRVSIGGASTEPPKFTVETSIDWKARAERAEEVLSHNMALANKNARSMQAERNAIIRKLREKYSAMEIADMVGLTRQRVHQILNEAPLTEETGPKPDAEKAPVTSAEMCPTWDQVQHNEHNGKCVYCGAPMPSQKASIRPLTQPERDALNRAADASVTELPDSHKPTCDGGTGGPCTQPDCEKCWDDEGRAVKASAHRLNKFGDCTNPGCSYPSVNNMDASNCAGSQSNGKKDPL